MHPSPTSPRENLVQTHRKTSLLPLERRLLATLRGRDLVRPGQRGLLLVSGGADSMALLRLLHALREPLQLRLEVLHFDHGLRPESGREADWVAARAGELGLPAHIVRTEHLAALRSGVQAAARSWRRTETERLKAQWEADWAATAHQRDDNLETLLMKWLRGAHLSRLRGMNWRNPPFIRPLLELRRSELTAYLDARGQEWLEDPSNRSPRYKRNRVRNELIPLLEELTGGAIGRRLEELAVQSGQLERWLDERLATHSVPQNEPGAPPHWMECEGLMMLPELERGPALHRFVAERLPGILRHSQIRSALELLAAGKLAWSLDLAGGRRLFRLGERLLLAGEPGPGAMTGAEAAPVGGAVEEPLPPVRIGSRTLRAPARWSVRAATEGKESVGEEESLALYNLPPRAELEVRARQPGDRFQPPWKNGAVKLKDFFRDQGIPLWRRGEVPLIVFEGTVIGVYPGFAARGYQKPENSGGGREIPPLRVVVFSAADPAGR